MAKSASEKQQTNPLLARLTRSQLSSIYPSCKELPLDRFIKLWSDKEEVFYLERAYDPADENYRSTLSYDDLLEHWKEIQLEYTELMDGGKMKRSLMLALQMERHRIRFSTLDGALSALSLCVVMLEYPEVQESVKTLTALLRRNDIDLDFDCNDPDSFFKDILRGKSLIKEIVAEIEALEAEAKASEDTTTPQQDEDGDEWIDTLITLGDESGFRIRAEDVTVYEYCRRVKKYIKNMKHKAKMAKKGIYGGT